MKKSPADSRIFASMPVSRLFWYCVLPGCVSMASHALYVLIDGMFVGSCMGHESLAAISLMWPLLSVCFALADMIGVGSSVQMGLLLGRGLGNRASVTFSFSVGLIIALGIFAGVAGYFGTDAYLAALGTSPETAALSTVYVRVYCYTAPLVVLFFASLSYLRVCGRQKFAMWVNVGVSLLNLLLDYIFIVKLRCGIWSASFTTCASFCVGAVISMWPFLRGRTELKFIPALIPLKQFLRMLANGSSFFFTSLSHSFLMLVVNALLLHLGGTTAVAATAAVMYIDSVVMMLLVGMNEAMQPALSYCYGAKLYERVLKIAKRLILSSVTVSLVALALMEAGRSYIVPLYAKEGDLEFITLGVTCISLIALSYVAGWVRILADNFLTAIDSPLWSFLCSVLSTVALPLLGLALLVPGFGVRGVWLTPLFSALTGGIFALWAMRRLWLSRGHELKF